MPGPIPFRGYLCIKCGERPARNGWTCGECGPPRRGKRINIPAINFEPQPFLRRLEHATS